jgi:WD40 repeat protein
MQIIRKSRLGNDTEDITLFSSLISRAGSVAAIDGYDVLDLQTTPPRTGPPIKTPPLSAQTTAGQAAGAQPAISPIVGTAPRLFDVLELAIKGAPRGITYAASRKEFVFNDDAQTAKLFFADAHGVPRRTVDIQYPKGAPGFVEGLAYIPAEARTFPDSLVMVAIFKDDNSPSGLQSRLEIISLNGAVVKEIVPQADVGSLFLTGVAVNTQTLRSPGTLLVSSDDDNVIHQIDFNGRQVSQFSPSPNRPGLKGIEGLVELPTGEIAVANGFAGLLEVFSPNEVPLPQTIDYRIGFGLSSPSGLVWDSTTNEFLLLGLERLRPDDRFVFRVASSLASVRLALNTDPPARKVTYLPDEKLIALAHASNPRGIQLFDERGQPAGVIDTRKLGSGPPVILSYLPETREFGIVFRDDQNQNKLSRLKRDGKGFGEAIDFKSAGIKTITAITFFKPSDGSDARFLVFDNTQDLFVVTSFSGKKLGASSSIRKTLRVLKPTAVTAITTGPEKGAFAICNGENSEVVVFRLD